MSKGKLGLTAVAFALAIGVTTPTKVDTNNTKFFGCASVIFGPADMDAGPDCSVSNTGLLCCYVPLSSTELRRPELNN